MTHLWNNLVVALGDPLVRGIAIGVAVILSAVPPVIMILDAAGKLDAKLRSELWVRYRSWLILAPLMLSPILLGRVTTILAVCVLSLLCYAEYARATGFFRERTLSATVVLGILLVTGAALDHWYALFVALFPIMVALIAAVAVLRDEPKGYVQRSALAVLGFALFGAAFGHLGYFANDPHFQPVLMLILLTVELNDVFAFIVGKSLGRRKLAPNTSPGKTMAGGLGALVLTTVMTVLLGSYVFRGTVVAEPLNLIVLGLIISIGGLFGDLMLSAVKRDVGVKDMGASIPGHGGLLDRFDSLILVAPAAFHFIGYLIGIGQDEPPRIYTGGRV